MVAPALAQQATDRREYDRHVQEARSGHPEAALAYLEELLKNNPGDVSATHDYIVILEWANRSQDAFALRQKIDPMQAPLYVVNSIAGSARKVGELSAAQRFYRITLKRQPDNLEATIGSALVYSDSGEPQRGLSLLQSRLNAKPARQDRIALLRAQADIYIAHGDFKHAANVLQTLVALDTKNANTKRDLAVVTDRAGAPGLALDILDQDAIKVDTAEHRSITLDRNAALIRWSGVGNTTVGGKTDYTGADRALAENTRFIDALSSSLNPDPESLRRARFDRVVALRNRIRMRETVALYESLQSEYREQLPAYVKVAAADAYLYLEQPERARDLYLQARKEPGGEDSDAGLGLFYAYIECEQFDEAYRLIDDLVKRTPKFDGTYLPAPPNPTYLHVRIAQAMARSYGDQQKDAGVMLNDLNRGVAFDSELRANRARWMAARGWLHQAQDEFVLLNREDPTSTAAVIGVADTQLGLRQYRAAEADIGSLAVSSPEDKGVQDLQRRWDIHNMRELVVESSWGRGSGAVVGNNDFAIESTLYSAPFNYNYRAFARLYDSQADFNGTTAVRRRAGAGLEYSDEHFTVSGAASQNIGGGNGSNGTNGSDVGIGLALEWRPDDFWTAHIKADSSIDDIPLRARPSNVTARGIDSDVVYRWNESSSARAGLGYQDFSDGNQRDTWNIGYLQRLIAKPHYKLDADISISGSQNSSIPSAAYFNPREDTSTDLTLINEWLTWRRYHDSFAQRLLLSVGDYHQQSFGSGTSWGVRYEHQWELQQRLNLLYGIGRSSHPYDGVNDKRNYVYLNLDWRF